MCSPLWKLETWKFGILESDGQTPSGHVRRAADRARDRRGHDGHAGEDAVRLGSRVHAEAKPRSTTRTSERCRVPVPPTHALSHIASRWATGRPPHRFRVHSHDSDELISAAHKPFVFARTSDARDDKRAGTTQTTTTHDTHSSATVMRARAQLPRALQSRLHQSAHRWPMSSCPPAPRHAAHLRPSSTRPRPQAVPTSLATRRPARLSAARAAAAHVALRVRRRGGSAHQSGVLSRITSGSSALGWRPTATQALAEFPVSKFPAGWRWRWVWSSPSTKRTGYWAG